jgi:hypothetical protein
MIPKGCHQQVLALTTLDVLKGSVAVLKGHVPEAISAKN